MSTCSGGWFNSNPGLRAARGLCGFVISINTGKLSRVPVAMLLEPVTSCEGDIFSPESSTSYKACVICV